MKKKVSKIEKFILRVRDGNAIIYIIREDKSATRIDILDSLAIRQHSAGFSWGYTGSGPSQTALAILFEVEEKRTALELYQDFKWELIAQLDGDKSHELKMNDIEEWIDLKLKLRKKPPDERTQG